MCERSLAEPKVREAAGTVMDGEDVRTVAAHLVHEAIGAVKEFADVLAASSGTTRPDWGKSSSRSKA